MPMGGIELLILLAIILMFFGAKRIPELARSFGKGTREFREGLEEGEAEDPGKAAARERGEEHSSQHKGARLDEQSARTEPNTKA